MSKKTDDFSDTEGTTAAPQSITVSLEDLKALIGSEVAKATGNLTNAVAAVKEWEPSTAEYVHNQRAYDTAPDWKPGCTYWRTGTKPERPTIV